MRRAAEAWRISGDGFILVLAVATACFLLGELIGCLLASYVGGGDQESPAAYVGGFLRAAQARETITPALASLVWDTVRWSLPAPPLGSTALGSPRLPLPFVVRGFLLTSSIVSFVCLFGGADCLPALLVFGVNGALSVPVLFMLEVQGLLAARVLAGRAQGDKKTPPPYGKLYFLRCGTCAVTLRVSLLLDCLVVPGLVSSLAGTLLSLQRYRKRVLDRWIINQVIHTI